MHRTVWVVLVFGSNSSSLEMFFFSCFNIVLPERDGSCFGSRKKRSDGSGSSFGFRFRWLRLIINYLGWHVCRTKLARKFSLKFLSLYLNLWVRKSPAKLPPNFPAKVPCEKSKNITCPSFPCLFFGNGTENHQKTRISYPCRTLKSLEKKGKTLKKKQGIPRSGKKQGIPKKNKERKDRVTNSQLWAVVGGFRFLAASCFWRSLGWRSVLRRRQSQEAPDELGKLGKRGRCRVGSEDRASAPTAHQSEYHSLVRSSCRANSARNFPHEVRISVRISARISGRIFQINSTLHGKGQMMMKNSWRNPHQNSQPNSHGLSWENSHLSSAKRGPGGNNHSNFLDTLHRFIFREWIRVIISPPITPNNFCGFKKRNSQEKLLGKDLAPYRIGKHSNPQNSPKIHQKY